MSVLDIDPKKRKEQLDKIKERIKEPVKPLTSKDKTYFRKIRTAVKKKK